MESALDCLSDINRLSREQSSDKRRETLRRVTDLFLLTSDKQRQEDSEVFGDVMAQMAFDLDVRVRTELSQRIADRPQTPRALALKLVNDEYAVAQPMLEKSKTLTPDDLVTIAKSRGQEHLLSISRREDLAPSVTDVLVERGGEDVIKTVVRNKKAQFSRDGFETLTMRTSDSFEMSGALAGRADMPSDLIEQVKDNANSTFTKDFGDADLGLSLEEIERVIGANAFNVRSDPMRARYRSQIEYLDSVGKLSEETIVRFAKAKRQADTAYALARLAGLEPRIAARCLFQASLIALAVLCRAVGLDRTTFWLLIQLRDTTQAVLPEVAVESTRQFDALDLPSAQRILRFLKVRVAAAKAA